MFLIICFVKKTEINMIAIIHSSIKSAKYLFLIFTVRLKLKSVIEIIFKS